MLAAEVTEKQPPESQVTTHGGWLPSLENRPDLHWSLCKGAINFCVKLLRFGECFLLQLSPACPDQYRKFTCK